MQVSFPFVASSNYKFTIQLGVLQSKLLVHWDFPHTLTLIPNNGQPTSPQVHNVKRKSTSAASRDQLSQRRY